MEIRKIVVMLMTKGRDIYIKYTIHFMNGRVEEEIHEWDGKAHLLDFVATETSTLCTGKGGSA